MSSIPTPDPRSLLRALASRVRRLREQRSWTRKELAQRSGLSVRFLARIESGDGNLSVLRLQALAEALGTSADELVRRPTDDRRPIALVGLREQVGVEPARLDTRLTEGLAPVIVGAQHHRRTIFLDFDQDRSLGPEIDFLEPHGRETA